MADAIAFWPSPARLAKPRLPGAAGSCQSCPAGDRRVTGPERPSPQEYRPTPSRFGSRRAMGSGLQNSRVGIPPYDRDATTTSELRPHALTMLRCSIRHSSAGRYAHSSIGRQPPTRLGQRRHTRFATPRRRCGWPPGSRSTSSNSSSGTGTFRPRSTSTDIPTERPTASQRPGLRRGGERGAPGSRGTTAGTTRPQGVGEDARPGRRDSPRKVERSFGPRPNAARRNDPTGTRIQAPPTLDRWITPSS